MQLSDFSGWSIIPVIDMPAFDNPDISQQDGTLTAGKTYKISSALVAGGRLWFCVGSGLYCQYYDRAYTYADDGSTMALSASDLSSLSSENAALDKQTITQDVSQGIVGVVKDVVGGVTSTATDITLAAFAGALGVSVDTLKSLIKWGFISVAGIAVLLVAVEVKKLL